MSGNNERMTPAKLKLLEVNESIEQERKDFMKSIRIDVVVLAVNVFALVLNLLVFSLWFLSPAIISTIYIKFIRDSYKRYQSRVMRIEHGYRWDMIRAKHSVGSLNEMRNR